MNELVPIIAIISTFGSIVWVIIAITNFILKRKLIDKGMVNEESIHLFKNVSNKLNSLKWGLIILSAGIGLIIINVMDADPDTALPYGIEAVAISLGFLGYYFIAKDKEQ